MNISDVLRPVNSASVTLTMVSGATSSRLLLDKNEARTGAHFYNHSTGAMFLRFAHSQDHSASLGTFNVKVASGSYYELPKPVYLGCVHAIWDAAVGSVMVTQYFKSDDYNF